MEMPLNLLFLCTGNSCRSIIAEALANHLGAGRLRAHSAGSHPTGEVHPRALAVLAGHGVPVAAPSSKSMDDLEGEHFDAVITVCDAAAGEACPIWLADTSKSHWGLPDPAAARGSDERIDAAFEATYQALQARLVSLLELELETLRPLALTAWLRKIHESHSARTSA
ncbi:arsenate reductase ArsC [Alloalcanivorax mobilis]|uniref:arsenate reductase ArsC n=1 Tax=Alloalcanivorax mobilis TaxID=2019569 RepID=UPI000C788F6F|nr:arsenate reductase ArsC [Alloalcanivorax mobilis]